MNILSMPTGLHPGIPPEVYHERVLGLASKGMLDLVHRSPAHYKASIDGTLVDESTPALDFGAAFHCAMLEPDRFETAYVVQPEFGDCRKAANKAARDAWRLEHASEKQVSAVDMRTIVGMVASVRRHPLASRMFRDGQPELTVRWQDEETGLQCRCRPDQYVPRVAMAADLKSSMDASPDAFRRDVAKYGYHRSAAFYLDGIRAAGGQVEHYPFIVAEKEPPYAVAVYSLSPEDIERGRTSIRADMRALALALATDTWPGYSASIQTLESLPPWAA